MHEWTTWRFNGISFESYVYTKYFVLFKLNGVQTATIVWASSNGFLWKIILSLVFSADSKMMFKIRAFSIEWIFFHFFVVIPTKKIKKPFYCCEQLKMLCRFPECRCIYSVYNMLRSFASPLQGTSSWNKSCSLYVRPNSIM